MAKFELSQEVREIEALIDAGDRDAASRRMQGAETRLGRRPEWRFLRCLFDASFRTRADREILEDAVALVGDQPDLVDASALLGELYARTGDASRAELFAREALSAPSEPTRARALRVLDELGRSSANSAFAPAASLPLIPSLTPARRSPLPPSPASFPPDAIHAPLTISEMPSIAHSPSDPLRASFPPPAPVSSHPPQTLSGPPLPAQSPAEWIEQARVERVQRRTPLHGVKPVASTVDSLLTLARSVADGRSPLSPHPLPLTRDGLAEVDAALLEWRKHRLSQGRRGDQPEPMAAAAFLLAVVLHELPEAYAIDTLPDDGGCKVALASGVGVRPILVASAYATGTGVSLLETFDRLSHAATSAQAGLPHRASLSSIPAAPGSSSSFPSPSSRPPHRASSGTFSAVQPPSRSTSDPAPPVSFPPLTTPVPTPMRFSSRPPSPVLTVTRAEAETVPVCRLEAVDDSPSMPPMDLPAEAAAFSRSPLGQEIASRSGAATLATSPAGVEALESYCLATRGEQGTARMRAWMPTPDEEQEIVQWGAFLGATLIALYGGRWEADPFAPSDARLFRVVCRDRVAAWPITQVYLRWKNGAAHDLISYLATVDDLLRA